MYTGLKVVYGFCDECFGALHLEKSDLFMSFRFAKGYKCFGALHLPKSVNHFQLSINSTPTGLKVTLYSVVGYLLGFSPIFAHFALLTMLHLLKVLHFWLQCCLTAVLKVLHFWLQCCLKAVWRQCLHFAESQANSGRNQRRLVVGSWIILN
jgi:hypothetical protein